MAIYSAISFSYEWERRFILTLDITSLRRVEIFSSKLLSLIILTYIPLLFSRFLVYLLATDNPMVFIQRYYLIMVSRYLHDLLIIVIVYIFVALPTVLFRNTTISLASSILPLLVLEYYLSSNVFLHLISPLEVLKDLEDKLILVVDGVLRSYIPFTTLNSLYVDLTEIFIIYLLVVVSSYVIFRVRESGS
jgi:hypothetical protein